MKKVVLLLIVLFSTQIFAQGYHKEVKNLGLGIGLGSIGIEGDATLPPLSVGLQMGITDEISVGGIVGYTGSTYKWGFLGTSYEWTYTHILIGARGEYHFLKGNKNLDAYAGLTLGYHIIGVTEPSGFSGGYTAAASSLFYGGHVGARYGFSESMGVFGELGYGISYLTVGLNIKL